jgi:hypothetical protein
MLSAGAHGRNETPNNEDPQIIPEEFPPEEPQINPAI